MAGLDVAAIAIIAASTAASVGSAMDQQRRSKNIADYQNAQQELAYKKSLAVNQEQTAVTAAERRRQIQSRYDAFKGAAAASAAERGASLGGSTSAVLGSLGVQASRESAKITLETTLNNQAYAVSNMPMWQVGQSTSPFLAGISGGLSGLSLGLNLQSSLNNNNAATLLQSTQSSTGTG